MVTEKMMKDMDTFLCDTLYTYVVLVTPVEAVGVGVGREHGLSEVGLHSIQHIKTAASFLEY